MNTEAKCISLGQIHPIISDLLTFANAQKCQLVHIPVSLILAFSCFIVSFYFAHQRNKVDLP